MALDWNVKNVKDSDALYTGKGEERRLSVVTGSLIYAMLEVGVREINKVNAEELFQRLWIAETVLGNFMTIDGKPRPFTLADVLRHVGLTTNVSDIGRQKFMNNLSARLKDMAKVEYSQQLKETQIAAVV